MAKKPNITIVNEHPKHMQEPNQFRVIWDNACCEIDIYNRNCEVIATTLIDFDDFDLCWDHKWSLMAERYAGMAIEGKKVYMHHLIIGWVPRKPFEVDHINRISLDNRKSNLHICTRQVNSFNKTEQQNNRSGFKGVHWHKSGKWHTSIMIDKKTIHIGYYDDPIDAALAYNEAARKYHGKFAFQNLI